MPKQADPFNLIKRPPSPYWHYKLQSWRSYKSTGQKTKTGAMKVVQEAISNNVTIESINIKKVTLGQYLENFFV